MSSARSEILEEFARRLDRLRPNQITDIVVEPLDLPTLYELIKVALDHDCYTTFSQPRLHARRLIPFDDTGYPGLAFAVPTYGSGSVFDTTFMASATVKDDRNEIYSVHDSSSPSAVLEIAHSRTSKEWVVFTHHDVYLPKNWGPRFWRAVMDAELTHGPIGVAGVFGVSGDRRVKRFEAGAVIDQDGTRTLVGEISLPATVRVLDGCVLATRKKDAILPDPELGWHFYDADMCLKAAQMGLNSVAVESWLLHRSAWSSPDERFKASEEIFRRKWARVLPVEVPCTLVF